MYLLRVWAVDVIFIIIMQGKVSQSWAHKPLAFVKELAVLFCFVVVTGWKAFIFIASLPLLCVRFGLNIVQEYKQIPQQVLNAFQRVLSRVKNGRVIEKSHTSHSPATRDNDDKLLYLNNKIKSLEDTVNNEARQKREYAEELSKLKKET